MSSFKQIALAKEHLESYRRIGTTAPECWYSHVYSATALSTFTTVDSTLYAIPFIVTKTITLDRIAINVTTLCTNAVNGRLGVFADSGNMYPGSLLLDAGEVALNSTGVKTLTISLTLVPGLYFLVLGTPAMGTAKAAVRNIPLASFYPVLGLPATLGTAANTYYSVTWTYGVLPSTYPASATLATAAAPGIFVRLSA